MSRWEALAFNTLHGLLAATGFAYFYMKYALETDDPFAVVNHARQPAICTRGARGTRSRRYASRVHSDPVR